MAIDSSVATGVGVFAVCYVLLHLLLRSTQAALEPPAVATGIPFVSPMLGMMRHGVKYYKKLRQQHPNLPIYTLRIPGNRIYVINATPLVSAAQRVPKIISNHPVFLDGLLNLARFSKPTVDILKLNVNGDEGHWGYMSTFRDAVAPPLAPGEKLEDVSRDMLKQMEAMADRVGSHWQSDGKDKSSAGGGTKANLTVNLFAWVRHQMTLVNSEAIYRKGNPLKEPEMEVALWEYISGIHLLLLGAPIWAVRRAFAAGRRVAKRFEAYYAAGQHLSGSAVVQARYEHAAQLHSLAVPDIALSEVTSTVALLANTVPSAYWTLYHIFADPVVLAECRRELEAGAVRIVGGQHTIDMARVKTNCPTLCSTFNEVLRVYNAAVSVRRVMQDHVLDGKYLLREGGLVMMPGVVLHTEESIWGDDARQFNARRFVQPLPKSTHAAFRPFGGGTTLCPGRHFVTTEILAFAAVLLMRFDLVPRNGSGQWVKPTSDSVRMWESTQGPDWDFEVEFRPREGEAHKSWKLVLSESG